MLYLFVYEREFSLSLSLIKIIKLLVYAALFYVYIMSQVKKSGMPPGPRAGFSLCVHKKRAVLFGGVVDMEMEG